jgi:uncharacterized membrane protein YvbJ
MFCTNCGKVVEAETKFCPKCGARQSDDPLPSASVQPSQAPASASAARPQPRAATPAPARRGKTAIWATIAALLVAIMGGVGYWGWSNKLARDEAVQKLTGDEAVRKLADEEQRRAAAGKTPTETTEIRAAQLALARHIATEEAEAQAQGR